MHEGMNGPIVRNGRNILTNVLHFDKQFLNARKGLVNGGFGTSHFALGFVGVDFHECRVDHGVGLEIDGILGLCAIALGNISQQFFGLGGRPVYCAVGPNMHHFVRDKDVGLKIAVVLLAQVVHARLVKDGLCEEVCLGGIGCGANGV